MIKINLAKTHSYVSGGTQATSVMEGASIGSSAESPVVKALVMVGFVVLVVGYEKYNLGIIEDKLIIQRQEAEKLKSQIAEYGTVEKVIEELQKDKQELNQQLKIIEKISQKRAFKLKAILAVQSNLPDDLWLKALNIKGDQIKITGFSRSPSSVQAVVSTLKKADFIDGTPSQEMKLKSGSKENIQEFNIQAKVVD